jgi:twitching motility protein PilT
MVKGQPIGMPSDSDHEPQLNKYFKAAIKTQASDLHLKVGQPPKLRIYGDLKSTTGETMTEERIEELVFEILSPAQKEFFMDHGTLDFAYEIKHQDRFRINIFRQRGAISLAARRVSSKVPPFESLHLPMVVQKIAETGQGLVLVVGPTGCGKSTTIASMINRINQVRSCHIVTIEDPIEYLFRDGKSIISQRAIGIDVKDYQEALKYMMRGTNWGNARRRNRPGRNEGRRDRTPCLRYPSLGKCIADYSAALGPLPSERKGPRKTNSESDAQGGYQSGIAALH